MVDKKIGRRSQGARQIAVSSKSQGRGVAVIDKYFKVSRNMKNLNRMMKRIAKEDFSVESVMSACKCVETLTETLNTTVKAANHLNGKP